MKKIYFLLISLLATMSYSQTTVFNLAGGGDFPSGWTTENNITTNDIDRGSYYLVDAGNPSDIITSPVIDLSTFSSAVFSVSVATFGSGDANPAFIEISFDGGINFTQAETTATPSSSSYIDGGNINLNSVSSQVVIRISNAGETGRGVRLRNIKLDAFGSDPLISIDGSSISGLTYFEGFGPSDEGDFSISGINLTENINVAAPANFEVSLTTGSGFGPSVVLTEAAGEVASTTIFVRLAAGLGVNTYSGDITASSAGATDATISVAGNVSPADPQISVFGTVGSLSYVFGDGPSAEDDFFVEGLFLSENITVTAPANFEVSLTTGSGFGPSVSVAQTAGTVPNTPVYVRLAAGLAEGPYSGDITINSAGVTPQTIALTGTVFGPPTNALVLTGVFDGPLTGGTPKGVEIFVSQDIPDLSSFGLSGVFNGGGSSNGTIGFEFPADAATAGSYIYVTTDAARFLEFFGFEADYVSNTVNINGDDAMELYENGVIIDTFGDVNTDGTGEPWDYLDGWAYRVDNSGPDGTNFVLANWTFSGINQLEGGTTNAETTVPFPIGTYTRPLSNSDFTSANFSIFPNPVTNGIVNINSNSADAMQVQVYDVLGKMVKSETLSNNTLDVSNLNTGLYIVKITQNQNSVTKKLVIR
jgi:hypothetical protein